MIWRDASVQIQPGLSGVELDALRLLGNSRRSISQTACELGVSYAYAWYIVYRLEARGLVSLERRNGNGLEIRALAMLVEGDDG